MPRWQRVVALTCAEPPARRTHRTDWAMAKTTGLSLRTVLRIWEAHGLQLHRVRSFKRSREADFVSKTEDIVAPSRPGAMPRNIPGGPGRNWTAQVSIVTRIRSD
jgi:hypothetical protein